VLIARVGRRLAKVLQEIRKDRMRVQRHVPENVVEDVRFGDVIERIARADRYGGREATPRERLEEQLRLEKALYRHGTPAGLGFETRIHLVEVRDAVALEADHFDPFKECSRRVLFEVLHAAVVERLPNAVVIGRVARPILADVEGLKAELDLFTMAVLVALHFLAPKRKRPVILITGRVS
jgi:hypothetical protein